MSGRSRVCVLQVPPFEPDRLLGGAEVVAVHLVRALAERMEVTVVHGQPAEAANRIRCHPQFPARVLAGFPFDDHVRDEGHIRPRLTQPAHAALTAADVVVTVERTLNIPVTGRRVSCLGGVGYPHTLDVLRHRAWDRLVVPSEYVAAQVAERAPDAHGVTVVENGIDMSVFTPSPRPRRAGRPVRLLVAGRPSWDKGAERAVGVARALQQSGTAARLTCVDQPGGFGPVDFSSRLRAQAVGVDLEILPWQPHPHMPAYTARRT
ncbi:MAG: glycosyltransferase [Actinobacteria bacterium]|nr:glycosyltransferase [Actinomycetota bacterium]MBI3687499.1 glycosyltransferase [Actinomycetota bacterium]